MMSQHVCREQVIKKKITLIVISTIIIMIAGSFRAQQPTQTWDGA